MLLPIAGVVCALFVGRTYAQPRAAADGLATTPLNILLFTADDLGADAVGVNRFGGAVPGLTPNLDRFAARGMMFRRAHVTSAICVPSRGAIATGRYGFSSGVYGFKHAHHEVPVVMEVLREHGYRTGILGKVAHSTSRPGYRWDYARDFAELGSGRSPALYKQACADFFAQCSAAGKPFYLMVNSDDPHRPFHDPTKTVKGAEQPSRLHRPEEIVVPEYLPDLPGVREELSHYYNSVRRLDDTFGKVMEALSDAGLETRTIVVFLSDNGIAMPFAKANCYLASTHTPLTLLWPGLTRAGAVDDAHFVTGIDLLPTFLDGLGLPPVAGVQGRSLVPLLRGERQSGRDVVFTHIDYKIAGPATPMRGVQDGRHGYIFTPWSDGATVYRNNNEGQTFKAMELAAKSGSPALAGRVRLHRYREVEEFYDLKNDPGCLHNLIDSAAHRAEIDAFRARMRVEMVKYADPLLATFDARSDPAKRKA